MKREPQSPEERIIFSQERLQVDAQVGLHETLLRTDTSLEWLAGALGVPVQVVHDYFSQEHDLTLRELAACYETMGYELLIKSKKKDYV